MQLLRVLGSGGFSKVYEAVNTSNASERVAVKLLILRSGRMGDGDPRLVARETQKRQKMFKMELDINTTLSSRPNPYLVQLLSRGLTQHTVMSEDGERVVTEMPLYSLTFGT